MLLVRASLCLALFAVAGVAGAPPICQDRSGLEKTKKKCTCGPAPTGPAAAVYDSGGMIICDPTEAPFCYADRGVVSCSDTKGMWYRRIVDLTCEEKGMLPIMVGDKCQNAWHWTGGLNQIGKVLQSPSGSEITHGCFFDDEDPGQLVFASSGTQDAAENKIVLCKAFAPCKDTTGIIDEGLIPCFCGNNDMKLGNEGKAQICGYGDHEETTVCRVQNKLNSDADGDKCGCASGTKKVKVGLAAVTCAPCDGLNASSAFSTACISSAEECPPGTYIGNSRLDLGPSKNSCVACPLGTWSSEIGSTECQDCSGGWTTRFLGSISADDCDGCAEGTRVDSNLNCHICGAGRYQDEQPQYPDDENCKECPAGTFLADDETSVDAHDDEADCFECPDRQFSKSGEQFCQVSSGTFTVAFLS